ncbi:MAG TPA: hypothetical protein VFG95_05380 [Nitrospiria bacterium]|nr:hypothetical protein [Nitrospiria bacterium]
MKNSSARQGSVKLTPEERQKVSFMKESARLIPILEGEPPKAEHQAIFSGIRTSFVQIVDPEGECAQYRLSLGKEDGQPGLDEVQALAALFFGQESFQILPDPKNACRVNVFGLFLPLSR